MQLMPNEHYRRLCHNGRFNAHRRSTGAFEIDFKPVVKLHTLENGYCWLLAELDPTDLDGVLVLWDTDSGPVLGHGSLFAILNIPGLTRDEGFIATQSIRQYAAEAERLAYVRA